jgi:RNA polymerase sigma-70 factor (ECF subfamily)
VPELPPEPPEVDHDVTVRVVAGSNASMQHRTLGRADLDEVVDAARQGDRDAFDELVRRTHADTYSLARRLVSDPDDARDVVQEAYLRAFRSIRKFRGDAQFTTWMHRITANCASTHLGRRRRHRHDELDEEVAVTDLNPERDPEAQADASLLRQRLEAAVADLPPRLRAVVVLRDVYDLGHAEIAEELGISESAAKVRLHRARRKLRSVVFPMRDEAPVELEEEDEARAV